ncbi:hypothetical protein GCM10020219_041060 [Nonomuraea dietziae]
MEGRARVRILLVGPEDDEEEDDEGLVVTMEFRRHDADTGATTVLAEPGRDAFWPATYPLERGRGKSINLTVRSHRGIKARGFRCPPRWAPAHDESRRCGRRGASRWRRPGAHGRWW